MQVVEAGLARQPAAWRGALTATPPPKTRAPPGVYRRHRPETTALYEVVRDNIETLFGAINDGALAVRLPRQREACPRGTRRRNERKRKRGLHRTMAKPANCEGLVRQTPSEAAPGRARGRLGEGRLSATVARGHPN